MTRARFAAIALAAFALSCGSSNSPRKLVLLHTNDEHSHALGFGPELDDFGNTAAGTGTIVGGASRRATIFGNERTAAKSSGADALVVSAGDFMIDTLVEVADPLAASDLRLMKILGYDVITLGNHEFDFGPGTLAKIIAAAQAKEGVPPIVSTNIHFPASGADSLAALYDATGADTTKPIHKTFIATTPNGLKVGFIGSLGADAAFKAPAKAPVTFSLPQCCGEAVTVSVMSQLFDDLLPSVRKLRRDDKVDLVVLLSHGGVNEASLDAGEDVQIAKNVPGIDVIVSGHTHTKFQATVVTNPTNQRPVLIQQAGAFGAYVGRIVLSVDSNKNVTFDTTNSKLLPVDDTTVGSSPVVDTLIGEAVVALESVPVVPVSPTKKVSFLEYTLSQSEGALIANDPTKPGNLYFRSEGKTSFDVEDKKTFKESQAQILVADAFLWAAENVAGKPTDVGVFAQGELRAGLQKGKTGNLAFADIFRVVPLGGSPANGTPGYPLCRYLLFLAELKAALDLTSAGLAQQSVSNSDFFVLASGIKFEFDLSRKPFDPTADPLDPDNGRVTKITIAHDHTSGVYETYDQVIYDASHLAADGKKDPFFGAPLKPYTAVMSLYVGLLSSVGGVKLKDPATGRVLNSPVEGILHRADTSEIKEWEALTGYIKTQSAANGGMLPARYNAIASTPRRAICNGSKCP